MKTRLRNRMNLRWPETKTGFIGVIIALLLPITTRAQLSDDFARDNTLNSSLWTTSSGLLTNLAKKFNSTLLTPTLSFGTNGMIVSGINKSNELAGVQSLRALQPPFTLTASLTAEQAHGNAFELFIASLDLTQWLDVAGNLNPGNGSFFGLWLNYDASGLPILDLGNDLYSEPTTGSRYTLEVFVESTGTATVSLFSSAGAALGVEAGLHVGAGPFYLILGQREGGPLVPGANVAAWQNVSVLPIAPAPLLAPLTWSGGTLALSWSTVAGATYQLQYSSTLAPAQWNDLGPQVTATGAVTKATDSPGPQRFYRVVLLK